MTKASELRAKDVAGLEKEVTDLLRAHFGLRMQKGTQQLANHASHEMTFRTANNLIFTRLFRK